MSNNPKRDEFHPIAVDDLLGSGGFGRVYRVTRRADGLQFAMKEIDCSPSRVSADMVLAEIANMQRVPEHPNIVRLHDHWFSADRRRVWLLMELCTQGSLNDLFNAMVESGRTCPSVELRVMTEAALHALAAFERCRIIHFDIKPDNIFIQDGVPKIGDLGLSRVTAGSVVSARGGTAVYMAPEVCAPPHRPSYQADVYSLGVTLYQLVMLRIPEPGRRLSLPDASVLRGDPGLRQCINEMLCFNPDKRKRAPGLLNKYFAGAPVSLGAPAVAGGAAGRPASASLGAMERPVSFGAVVPTSAPSVAAHVPAAPTPRGRGEVSGGRGRPHHYYHRGSGGAACRNLCHHHSCSHHHSKCSIM